jgi:hypothetical protein
MILIALERLAGKINRAAVRHWISHSHQNIIGFVRRAADILQLRPKFPKNA